MLCIQHGLIHTMEQKEPFIGDILIENGVILSIAPQIDISDDMEVIDATNLSIYPGFIEAHCHIGLDGYGIGYEGHDYNERNHAVTPHLRGIDGINPFDPCFEQASKAGITCVATGPGSSNVLGGTFVALKTYGTRVDDMIVKDPIAMKCAFGENPKNCYRTKEITSRMTTSAILREALLKAKQYQEKLESAHGDPAKEPAFDMKSEALLPVLKKEIPLKAHAHQANDIFTALRIAKEFDLDITLEHVTEGHLIAEDLAKEQVPLAIGPSFTHATKFELQNKTFETPGILANLGCQVSIITDSPVIPQQYLPLCAGLAVKSGMDPYEALKAITIHPAKHLGIADRVGSLLEGKDADIVITNGNPLSFETDIKYVLIDGKLIHKH